MLVKLCWTCPFILNKRYCLLFQMVHQLVSMGANIIWEHSLLDPSQVKQGIRKPNPRDPVQYVSYNNNNSYILCDVSVFFYNSYYKFTKMY